MEMLFCNTETSINAYNFAIEANKINAETNKLAVLAVNKAVEFNSEHLFIDFIGNL